MKFFVSFTFIFFISLIPVFCNSISQIEAVINLKDGSLSPEIQAKISNSIIEVGKKSLVGKTIKQGESIKNDLEKVVQKIFSELLTGFKVDKVEILISEITVISLTLSPQAPSVKKVYVRLNAEGINPEWNEKLQKDADKLIPKLSGLIMGLPITSSSWAEDIIQKIISTISDIKYTFPGFNVEPEIEFGEETYVKLILKPKEPIIRLVRLKIRSLTIPSLIIDRFKLMLTQHTDLIIGLPIEFFKEKKELLKSEAKRYVESKDTAKKLGILLNIDFILEKDCLIMINIESNKYLLNLRAMINIGADEGSEAEGKAGIIFGNVNEVFYEMKFYPSPISFKHSIGIGKKFSRKIFVALGRNFTDNSYKVWSEIYLSQDIIFRWHENLKDHKKEASLIFKAHEFFNFEGVSNFKDDAWIRFTANM